MRYLRLGWYREISLPLNTSQEQQKKLIFFKKQPRDNMMNYQTYELPIKKKGVEAWSMWIYNKNVNLLLCKDPNVNFQ